MKHERFVTDLGQALQTNPALKVLGYCMKSDEVISQYEKLQPAILLIDVHMPPLDVYKVIGDILKIDKNAKIIGTAGFFCQSDADKLKRIGAKGYLLRNYDLTVMLGIINAIYLGETIFNQQNIDKSWAFWPAIRPNRPL